MEAPRYRVVFRGELMPGADPAEVRKRLAAMFKIELSRIEPLFSGRKMVVKKDLSVEEAKRYRSGFRAAGAVAHIETAVDLGDRFAARRVQDPQAQARPAPRLSRPSRSVSQGSETPTTTCPRCRTRQPESSMVCSSCGHQLKTLAPRVLSAPRRAAAAAPAPQGPAAPKPQPPATRPAPRPATGAGGRPPAHPVPDRHVVGPVAAVATQRAPEPETKPLVRHPVPEPEPIPPVRQPIAEPEPIPPVRQPIPEPAPPVSAHRTAASSVVSGPWPAAPEAEEPAPAPQGPPLLQVNPATPMEIIGTTVLASLLHLIVVGLFVGPRMVWGLLASQVIIDEETLTNDDLWIGVRTILFGIAGGIGAFVVMLPLVALLNAFGVTDVWWLGLLTAPLTLAPAFAGFIYSLTTNTLTRRNEEVFRPVFLLEEPATILDYARHEWKSIVLGGAALWCTAVFFLTPLGLAFIFHEWFKRLEVDGYRFRLRFPWRLVVESCVMALPTLGLWTFFGFIPRYFSEVLRRGYWQRIPTSGQQPPAQRPR